MGSFDELETWMFLLIVIGSIIYLILWAAKIFWAFWYRESLNDWFLGSGFLLLGIWTATIYFMRRKD